MKNLLIAILLLVAVSAWGQTTYTLSVNPQTVTITDTNTNIIRWPGGGRREFFIFFPAANSGTVQINTESTTLTYSTVLSNTLRPAGIYLKAKDYFYIKMSASNDKVDIIMFD